MMLMRCEYCEGRKTVRCPDCADAQDRLTASPDGKDVAAPACGTCGGRREVECPGCLGTGFVDMPTFA